MKKLFITTLVFVMVIAPASFVVGDAPVNAAENSITSPISKILPSTVTIVISKKTNRHIVIIDPLHHIPAEITHQIVSEDVGAGSGFIISHDGYIATNNHVVLDSSADYTAVLADGTSVPAHVVYQDPHQDIALLKIDRQFSSIATLGSSKNLTLGEPVVALGNAYGQVQNSIAPGAISGFNKNITAGGAGIVEELHGLLQSSSEIVPGYSGGPLIDMNGNVVGINVAKDNAGDSSFFIPIEALKNTLKSYPVI